MEGVRKRIYNTYTGGKRGNVSQMEGGERGAEGLMPSGARMQIDPSMGNIED